MANEIIKGLGFHHIALKAADYEKSVAMYTALGLTKYAGWNSGDKEITLFDLGDGGKLELFSGGGDDLSVNGKWLHFAMRVEDAAAAYRTALAAGFRPQMEPKLCEPDSAPKKIRFICCFVVGPDGEQLEFFQELN